MVSGLRPYPSRPVGSCTEFSSNVKASPALHWIPFVIEWATMAPGAALFVTGTMGHY